MNLSKALSHKILRRMVHFEVQPQFQLVDQLCKIKVENLQKDKKYSIIASLLENKNSFYSRGDYQADESGCIDLTKHASLAGTYRGVEPMGLFWGMQPVPGQIRGIRLMKKSVETPFNYKLFLVETPEESGYADVSKLKIEASCSLQRWYWDQSSVTRQPIKTGRIRGTLFLPKGTGPFPTVLDMFGTAGGCTEFRASLLASHGFASLALAYFNYDDLPNTLNFDFDYFMEAMLWLAEQKFAKHGKIGVIGVSKGAELACLSAIHCDKVEAIVCISGAQALIGLDMPFGNDVIKASEFATDTAYEHGNEGLVFPMPDIDEEAVFPLEKSSSNFLFLCGAEDPLCGPWCIESMVERLKKHKKNNWQMCIYPGTDDCMFWGGQPKAHSLAQEHSWKTMLTFLREQLNSKSKL